MRKLTEAIVANLEHYAQMVIEESMSVKELSEVLGVEPDSEHIREIMGLVEEIRHKLGETNAKARRLLHLLKYGPDD